MTLLPLNLAEAPNRKQRHRSSPRCPHSADVIMFGFSLFNIVRAAHKVNYMYNSCSILNWLFSRVQLFATPWSPVRQAPLPLGFSRQENWSGLPCSPPGDLPNLGIEPRSPALQADSLLSEPPVLYCICIILIFETSRTKYP